MNFAPLDLARIQRAWAAAKLTPSPPSPAVDAPHTTGTDGVPAIEPRAPLGGGGLRNCWTCRFAFDEATGCKAPWTVERDEWVFLTHTGPNHNACPRDADGCPSHSPSTPPASPPPPAPGPASADGIVFEQWDDAVEWTDPWAALERSRNRECEIAEELDAWKARALAAEERCSWAMRALADREPARLRDLLHARIAGWLGVAP